MYINEDYLYIIEFETSIKSPLIKKEIEIPLKP